jgi:hypothetical protein
MNKTNYLKWLGSPLVASMILISCDSKDPAMEEEQAKLRLENKNLAEKLKAASEKAESGSSEIQEELTSTKAALAQAQGALEELKARFDRKRLEASFSSAVSDFKEQTLKKFPGHTITQVTMHEMILPSDHPFSSGLTMLLQNGETGQTQTVQVKALGNIDGEWSFQKIDPSKLTASRPLEAAPPVAQNPPSPPPAQPQTPPAAPQIQVKRQGPATAPAGKVHTIDWGDQ